LIQHLAELAGHRRRCKRPLQEWPAAGTAPLLQRRDRLLGGLGFERVVVRDVTRVSEAAGCRR